MTLKGPFSRLLLEFGSESSGPDEEVELPNGADASHESQQEKALLTLISRKDVGKAAGSGKLEVSMPLALAG
jgi:hypothetical protein